MAAHAPNVFPPLAPPGNEPRRELFSDLVVSGSERPRRTGALPISLAAHVLAVLAIGLVPLFWSADPTPTQGIQALLYNPPPPPPPPLAFGSNAVKVQPVKPKADTEPKRATPKPDMSFTVPKETKPVEPEAAMPTPEQSGSPEGTVGGDPNGMLEGVQGGVVGGVPGGVLGGVLGGTGDAVTDYEQPARLLNQSRPVYPHDAFIKQIKGTVVVEIMIDATGHVIPVRIVESIPGLDKAAIECVRQWTFAPAMKHGRPVAMVAQAPIRFNLL